MMKHHLLVALAGISLASGSAVSNRFSESTRPPGAEPRALQPGGSAKSADKEPTWDRVAEKFGGTKADTKPCKDVTMSFPLPVEIRTVAVVGGQAVKMGDLLIRARDDEQVAVVVGRRSRPRTGTGSRTRSSRRSLRT